MTVMGAHGKRVSCPRVSVVIPTYNRANDVVRCLDSLKLQTIQDFEVLLCDDGSTDGTSEIWMAYREFLDITYDYSENFGGPARPRNRGIELARAPFVAFLDSDDWWMPEKLEISLAYLERGADLVYHDLIVVTKSESIRFGRRSPTRRLKSPVFDDLIVNGNALTNSSVVIRKSILTKVNGFSEERDLIAAEDYDAWLRISRVTEKFQQIPKPLGYYWAGGGHISGPARLLRNIEALEQRYMTAFNTLSASRDIYWVNYARGRAYYSIKSYRMAKANLQLIKWGQAPFVIWFKSTLVLILINFFGEST